jgi:hypothetical protein
MLYVYVIMWTYQEKILLIRVAHRAVRQHAARDAAHDVRDAATYKCEGPVIVTRRDRDMDKVQEW